MGKKEEIEMIRCCYRSDKARGRALRKLIETKWKWPIRKVPGKKSKWCGVGWNAKAKKWFVQYKYKRVQYWVGYYDDETEAAEAHDDAVRAASHDRKLNFPKRRSKRAPRKKPASSKGAAKKKPALGRGRKRSCSKKKKQYYESSDDDEEEDEEQPQYELDDEED